MLHFSLLFSFSLRSSLCFCLSGTTIIFLTVSLPFFLSSTVFFTATQNLLNVGSRIDTSCGSSEHLLQPDVGLVSLLTCENHAWLDVDFLTDHHFSECNQFYEESKFAIFIFETF